MSFISHAQNREDVLLWRVLRHVSAGFYVDVGANHPNDDSVTKAFYDRGWSGINIEPLAGHFRELKALRPRDVNLCVAVGATEGEIELFDTPVRGLATASAEVAQGHRAGGMPVRSTRVPLRRLDAILAEHAPTAVHFLKIDVEGFEEDVLKGMDFVRWRPWVVVVEATRPNSSELDTHWEALVTDHGYRPVYFDGLNRYYLADEHPELAAAFGAPPNVFDDYVTAEHARLRLEVEQFEKQVERLQQDLEHERTHQRDAIQVLEGQIHALRHELNAVYGSHSWRVTAPLRRTTDVLRRAHTRLRRADPSVVAVAAEAAVADAPVAPPPDTAADTAQAKAAAPQPAWVPWHECALPHTALAPRVPEGPGLPASAWWRVVGHVEGHYSLAVVNRGLAVALDAVNRQQVQWVAWHGQAYRPGTDMPAAQQAAVQALLERSAPAGAPVVSLVHHYPLLADEAAADLRLAMFFWEESRVPPETVAHLNAHTHGVLVASRFVQRVLRHSGYEHPIFVIPLGLGPEWLQAPLPDRPQTPTGEQPFRFLHVSSAFERKGVDLLLQAFFERFSAADGVELVIKTFANPHHDVQAQVRDWQARCPNGPAVHVNLDPLDDAGMRALYESAHAVVLPSRGEGFNLPAAEALALGVPLVVTADGGQADFASLQTAALLPYRVAASRSHLHTPGSCWLEPDLQALGQQMHTVRAQVLAQDAALNQRRLAAAQWVRTHYRWELSAQAVQAAAGLLWAQRHGAQAPGRQRLLVLGPWHTACGVAEYAQALLAGWEPAFELEVMCDHRTQADPFQRVYTPCWALGDHAAVQKLLESVLQRPADERPDVLLVQHQQSLFTLSDGVCAALARLRQAGVVVVLELHSTLPPVREGRISDRAAADLRGLDLVVVHKLDDVNYLLGIGLVDNVMCLPLGVTTLPDDAPAPSRADWQLAPDDLVLGCFGFLLPHKGLDVVIASLPELARASGRRVRLLAVTAALDTRSQQTLADCRALADRLGVAQDVVWATDFLPMQDCLRLLSLADFQLFVYGPTRESASAAVTAGLATRKPVLVSPQPIFSDLSDCTFRLQGNTPADVVAGVMQLLQSPATAAALQKAQDGWLQERAWHRLSARLKAAVLGLRGDRLARQGLPLSDPPQQRQLLVDVSELVLRDARTGIQRVVRNILQAWLAHPPAGYAVRPVCASKGQAYRYATRFMAPPGAATADTELDDRPVQAGLGDVFVGLDLSAHLFPQVEAELRAWRLAGTRVCYVVYDIIPLQMPAVTVPGMTEAFATWMQGLRREADRLVCISHAVADEVRLWLCAHTAEGALPEISAFHLGTDLPVPADAPCPPEARPVLQRLSERPTLLMVGTVEPRKGHAQALSAMERLWERGVDVALVVVGKPGWMVDALCDRLRQHAEQGRRLHWLEQADDATLAQLYRHCSGLLAASEAEGFGLPLVEAAQHGLPIVARGLPVFKEVAGEHAFYFDGQAPEVLAFALEKWLGLRAKGQVPDSRQIAWQTWQASARQLLEVVL